MQIANTKKVFELMIIGGKCRLKLSSITGTEMKKTGDTGWGRDVGQMQAPRMAGGTVNGYRAFEVRLMQCAGGERELPP